MTALATDGLLPRPAETAIFRALPEGGVLFSTASVVYFGVNLVGARIWELLPPKTRTFAELESALVTEYSDVSPDVIRADARRFLEQLQASGLVHPSTEDSASSDAPRP